MDTVVDREFVVTAIDDEFAPPHELGPDRTRSGPTVHTLSRANTLRRKQGELARGTPYTLPKSKVEVLVRRPSIITLLRSNVIPLPLQERINTLVMAGSRGRGDDAVQDVVQGGIGALMEFLDLADIVCIAGFVDPQVVSTPDQITDPDTQICVDDMDPDDRLAYWRYVIGQEATAAAPVAEFPDQSNRRLDSGRDGEAVR